MVRAARRVLSSATLCIVALCASPLAAADDSAAEAEGLQLFESKIRPVLVEKCYECHSSKAAALEGSLSLESRDAMRKGGDRGPAIVPGDPDKSLLLKALTHADKDFQMPPKERLPDETIADFAAWIKRGAPDPRTGTPETAYAVEIEEAKKRWPFTPPVEPPLPEVANKSWPRSPIDHFVLARLESSGLVPAADADKRTLLRRVSYDLTGLPPTPDETAAFLADESEEAFAKVVDRLLESPHYGERYGRHWLDVVRYADTAGDNSDYPIPQMYRYRNWVIEALNADLPFDDFVRQQIAGDLLPAATDDERQQKIIATGYLANARRFGSRVDDYPQHLTIEDTIDNLGKAFLGMSLNCARCHNHKFDPFTAEDYYALYGIFHSTQYPWPGIELDKRQRNFAPLAPAEVVAAAKAERKKAEDSLNESIKGAEQAKNAASMALKQAKDAKADEKELERLTKAEKEADEKLKSVKKEKEELQKQPLPFETAYAVAEAAKIENCKLHIKGDPAKLGNEVPRRFPLVLGGQVIPPDAKKSGRAELAEWIASPSNPLTARVIANRLWHWHFGRGIVPTPNDFGRQGRPPSHPELLDWLAIRLVESGWSLKAMHRLILTSHAYQMAGAGQAQESGDRGQESGSSAYTIDANNELLWHFPRRRLSAEEIRDTLLVLGGNLDRSPGREHPFPPQQKWDFTQHKPFKAVYETNRRSIYLMTQRIQRHPLMAIFDGPDTGASTGSRPTSTTTLQALYFLNDPFVHEQARQIAARVLSAGSNDDERIDLAYQMLFAREPADEERTAALAALDQLRSACNDNEPDRTRNAWESLLRVLLRTNEFVYVD